jgi:hypothetical protein
MAGTDCTTYFGINHMLPSESPLYYCDLDLIMLFHTFSYVHSWILNSSEVREKFYNFECPQSTSNIALYVYIASLIILVHELLKHLKQQ